VSACRDPVRCHNCRGCGHRLRDCKMPIARVLTPKPRHRLATSTIPTPTQRAPVHAVTFSPRSASPPAPMAPPPPTPAHAPARTAALNPLGLIASSSIEEANFELPSGLAAAVDTLRAQAANMLQLAALLSATKRSLQTPANPTNVELTHSAVTTDDEDPVAPPPSSARSSVRSKVVTKRGRRPRVGLQLSAPKPQRQSTRLAEKAKGLFVDSTDKAVQLKALQNALLPCSSQLKKAVGKKSLLTRSKLPIAPADLRRMVAAARIGNKPVVPPTHP